MPIYLIASSEVTSASSSGKKATYRTFDAKPKELRALINEAIHILDNLGIPVEDKTPRRLERMALAFLTLCDVKNSNEWPQAKSLRDTYALKTRDIIEYINQHFYENISRGSYDDIRRKDLKHLRLADIVIPDRPNSARNDPKRAWAINAEYVEIIRTYHSKKWQQQLKVFMQGRQTLREHLAPVRNIVRIPITLPSGVSLQFGPGEHNQLQKAVIEEFLPRYGYGAQVIYVGDAEDKLLHYDQRLATEIGLLPLAHEELPDVIAYSKQKNWLYLIEAVHSSGPMSQERILTLQSFLQSCTASIVYVTAFLDRVTLRKFLAEVAWETEVWIASNPDHLIHFNGDKFLGPFHGNGG